MLRQRMFVYQSQQVLERDPRMTSLFSKRTILRVWVLLLIMKMPNNILAANEYVHNLQKIYGKIKDVINVSQQK